MRTPTPTSRLAAVVLVTLALMGCGTVPEPQGPSPVSASAPGTADSSVSRTPAPSVRSPAPPAANATPSASPSSSRQAPAAEPLASDGEPLDATLSIPDLDIDDLRVEPYRGSPDDAPGTRIQDRGIAASPHGPNGGVGPGGIGNYIVTAHRLSSTQAFLDLPDLRRGDEVSLVADGQRYVYRITETRRTSFRSERSLAAQSAPVPGRPGVEPTKAMITLSTCRTPEDRAEGNFWSDEFGNPENRIDKIGELVEIEPA